MAAQTINSTHIALEWHYWICCYWLSRFRPPSEICSISEAADSALVSFLSKTTHQSKNDQSSSSSHFLPTQKTGSLCLPLHPWLCPSLAPSLSRSHTHTHTHIHIHTRAHTTTVAKRKAGHWLLHKLHVGGHYNSSHVWTQADKKELHQCRKNKGIMTFTIW